MQQVQERLKTSDDWLQLYRRTLTTSGYHSFYTPAKEEAMNVGKLYMMGQLSVSDVFHWLRTIGSIWPFDGWIKSNQLVAKGCEQAIKEGIALVGRIPPIQDVKTLEACKKRGKNKWEH